MSETSSALQQPRGIPPSDLGAGLPLLVIATAQLMLVLDDSIANIALPTIQNELGVSSANLPWVINAYILAFGGLLLFGGRMGDLFGRRRMLQWAWASSLWHRCWRAWRIAVRS
jgi:MFS family permease